MDGRSRDAVELVVARDHAEASERVAELLAEAARAGRALALSGGSTPRLAYERAAVLEPDWSASVVWLADERCVPPDDPRSNARLLHEALIDRLRVPPALRPVPVELGAGAAADRYDALLRDAAPPSLVVLGVGSDGHTASLVPSADALAATERLAVAAAPALEPLVPRVTLTLAAISRADDVVFLVTGADKAEPARRAFGATPSPVTPASLARSARGRTVAILDAAAAAHL